ncbi:MAG: YqiA/YcfP family alpha/beta fold hydrolase [Gammaproteobacteria bacterium]
MSDDPGPGIGPILYIHGFGSCGDSTKSRVLKACFGADSVIHPDLSEDPARAIAALEAIIKGRRPRLLVGSSLGGFYADHLNGRHRIPSVLINPSTVPFDTLAPHLGPQKWWCSGETFELRQSHLDSLRHMYRGAPGPGERYLCLLHTGDEVLDYRLAAERYADKDVIIEEGGTHRFENLEDYREAIETFSKHSMGRH